MYKIPEDGDVSTKHVGPHKELHC